MLQQHSASNEDEMQQPAAPVPQVTAEETDVPHADAASIVEFPHEKERSEHHTLSVRDVVRVFEDAGVRVAERTITNWCNPNTSGQCRLDCYYAHDEHRYYITPQSVDHVLKEERVRRGANPITIPQFAAPQNTDAATYGNEVQQHAVDRGNLQQDTAPVYEHVRQETADVPQAPQPSQHNSHEEIPQQEDRENKKAIEKRLLDLERQNIELQSQLKTKEALLQYVENKMLKEQERHEEREDKLINLVAEKAEEVGEITQKLLQLEAPKPERVRDVTDEHAQTHEPTPVRYINEQEQEY